MSQENNPKPQRTIDERINAFAADIEEIRAIHSDHTFCLNLHSELIVSLDTKLENLGAKIDKLTEDSKRDAESIRTLARIAEIHGPRRTSLEGDQAAQQ